MLGGKNFRFNAYSLANYSEQDNNIVPAWNISTALEDRNIDISASITEIGKQFDPAMGYVGYSEKENGIVKEIGNIRRYKGEFDYIYYHDDFSSYYQWNIQYSEFKRIITSCYNFR